MLPDFPKIKCKWSARFAQLVRAQVNNASFVSQIKKIRYFEGDVMNVTDSTGETEESNFKQFSGGLEVNNQDLIERGPFAFMEGLDKLAMDLSSQQTQMIFESLEKTTAKTGNIVNSGEQEINPDHILLLLEKIELDFSEDGQLRPPTFVLPTPKDCERLNEKLPEWEKNEDFKRKFIELIERKKQEWNDRESHRKLVD